MSLNKSDEVVFEDSLLIIKSVYLHKRRPILLKLLSKGFQIQGNRRLLFSPEKAAEFYGGDNENKHFMLLVIMLSEGTSEAFILARQNCVIELLNTMICYFCNSKEMEKNVHVSRSPDAARFEISYIFPNYIHEPLPIFYDVKFPNSLLVKDIITEAYNIASDPNDARRNWKKKMIEWLNVSNSGLPRISHQCKPRKPTDDKGVTATIPTKTAQPPAKETPSSSEDQIVSLTSGGSSALITSSSCITCSCFDGEDTCYRTKKIDSLEVIVAKKKTRLSSSSLSVTSDRVCEEVEWREIAEESIGSLSEKSCLEEHVGPPSAFPPQDSEGGGSLIIRPPGENPLPKPEDGGVTVTNEVGPDGTVTQVITFIESPSGPAEITEIVAEAEYGEPLYEKVEDLFEEAQEIMENDKEISPADVVAKETVIEGEDGPGLGAEELYAKAEELVEENVVEQQGVTTEGGPDETLTVATTYGDEQPLPPE